MQPQIRLLGQNNLYGCEGRAIGLPTRKSWALLGYIVQSGGRDIPRDELAALIWPSSGEAQARASLRQELSVLKRALDRAGLTPFEASKEFVRLSIEADNVDVLRLEKRVARNTVVALREAAALYGGEFLAGIAIRSDSFDHWLWLERQRLKNLVLSGLLRLLREDEAAGQSARAIATASAVLGVEPTQEQAHRALMRLYRRTHRRAEALRQYRYCCDLLRRDLDTEPSRATQDLAEEIRAETGPASITTSLASMPAVPAQPVRRLLSLLVAELAPEPSRSPDIEAMAGFQAELRERAAEILKLYGGTLIDAFGGRLVAAFGYPRASEFDAARAAEAALALAGQPVVTSRGERRLRCAVAAGDMIVLPPTSGPSESDAAGPALAEAGRLAKSARAGDVHVSAAAAGFLRPRYLLRPASPGTFRLLGLRRRPGPACTRPLIGREDEREQTAAIWERARHGRLHAVSIAGATGIGKSHLLRTVAESCEGGVRLHVAAQPMRRLQPFYPFLTNLEPLLGLPRRRDPAARLEQLLDWGASRGADLSGLKPVLAATPRGAAPQAALDRVHEALAAAFRARVGRRPLILAVDDVHCLDAASGAFLVNLVETAEDISGLILATHRQDARPAWLDRLRAVPLALGPLGDRDAGEMADTRLPKATPDRVRSPLLARARGVPFYIAELAQAVVGQAPEELPLSLQPHFIAALDRLGPGRDILQTAAVAGARFSVAQLADVTGCDASEVTNQLTFAEELGLVERVGRGPRAEYEFGQPLARETVLSTLMSERRAALTSQAALARARRTGPGEAALTDPMPGPAGAAEPAGPEQRAP